MNINEIVEEKKKGLSLSKEEIDFLIFSYNNGKISDSKMIDFMRIVNESNFSYEETYYLANALARTGTMYNIFSKVGFTVDKHSAGSMSDPATLVFMSVLASIGVKNVKVLSSEFGDYGNTLDRFKVFNGFNAKISEKELKNKIEKHGVGVIEDTGQIAPADKRLYRLRKKYNITSTPLVASSILAKKIAMGATALIYDVKTGEGAIVPSVSYANTLAEYLVNSSKLAGFLVACVITNLNQPLGSSLGVKVEIEEALAILKSERALYDSKLLDVSRELVIMALILSKVAEGRSEANKMFEEAITSGRALDKFKEIVNAYGGRFDDIYSGEHSLLEGVAISYIVANDDGYVEDVVISKLMDGYLTLSNKTNNTSDKNAGIVLLVREGMKVDKGEKIARIFYSIDNENFFNSVSKIKESIVLSKTKPNIHKVFYKVIV